MYNYGKMKGFVVYKQNTSNITNPDPVMANWGQDVRRVVKPVAVVDEEDVEFDGELVPPEAAAAAAAAAFR